MKYLRISNAIIIPLTLCIMAINDIMMMGDWIGGLFLLCAAFYAYHGVWNYGRD